MTKEEKEEKEEKNPHFFLLCHQIRIRWIPLYFKEAFYMKSYFRVI